MDLFLRGNYSKNYLVDQSLHMYLKLDFCSSDIWHIGWKGAVSLLTAHRPHLFVWLVNYINIIHVPWGYIVENQAELCLLDKPDPRNAE